MGATYPRTENDQYNEEYVRQYLNTKILSEDYIQSVIASTHGSGEPSVNLTRFLLECDGWVGKPTGKTSESGIQYQYRQDYNTETKQKRSPIDIRAMDGRPNPREFKGPRLVFTSAGGHLADPNTMKPVSNKIPTEDQRRVSHMHERKQDQPN